MTEYPIQKRWPYKPRRSRVPSLRTIQLDDKIESEEIDLTPEQKDKVKLLQDIHELNERNLKALDRFRSTDDEMHRLVLDNMMMLTMLGIRSLAK